ncbi:flagellar hook protein FlgE [Maridesulfovibrio ferrireducens]|uniref:Flagellar hook protein FlgE n=1 Tax=Maridesulfovibrio ferrireducens TaxID=246191 RepID=A0A1G9FLJ8_9BACT|nr:flagellar hook-basal body complex protein [Maridesulfovibrio ferrireducens]SDK89235.1 flagellar hook protein FlgE [Maridesulfovibrio ferrireducens]
MGFSAMYTGASGIKAHSMLLQQAGSNLANVNTTAYKSGNTFLENLQSQTATGTISGVVAGGSSNTAGQIGMGVRVSSTRINFAEGSFERSSSSTDLAIGGQGFFRVAEQDSGLSHYTRAGNFHFDKNGLLVDPHTNALQGYAIDSDGNIGTTSVNVALPMKEEKNASGQTILVVKSDPKATSDVSMKTNLDSGAIDNSQNPAAPFFSLLNDWDGTKEMPLAADKFAYHSAIQIFDKSGNKMDMTVYYDKVTPSESGPSDKEYWEYIVTVPPGSDGRTSTAATSSAGLLMTGTLTFAGDGTLLNQTAYSLSSNAAGSPKDLNNWTLTNFNTDGEPTLSTALKGATGEASVQQISIDLGVKSASGSWNTPGASAAEVGSNASGLPTMENGNIDALSTTNYYGSSSTISQSQDGFGEGYLQNVSVNSEGILSGKFSNGLSTDLYKINLYNFKSEYGLRREGSNYFGATDASGAAIEGVAQKKGLGSILGSNLETSNVDLAREFGSMILTQRGYQANSKVITTQDQLINTTLGVKK